MKLHSPHENAPSANPPHQAFAPNGNYDPHLADLNGDGAMDIVAVHSDGAMAGYFSEMSNGKFTFTKAGAFQLGPYDCTLAQDWVRVQLEDAANQDGPGGFEFSNLDTNSDGTVSANELVILGISTVNGGPGQTGGQSTTLFPGTARQVHISVMWSYAGAAYSPDTWAHELAHTLATVDLYGSNCRNLGLTLASCSSTTTYWNRLDAWHKMRLGWVRPLIYDIRDFPAGAAIAPAQTADERPVILYDHDTAQRSGPRRPHHPAGGCAGPRGDIRALLQDEACGAAVCLGDEADAGGPCGLRPCPRGCVRLAGVRAQQQCGRAEM